MTERVKITVVYKFKSQWDSSLGRVKPDNTLSMKTYHANSIESVEYEARTLIDMLSTDWQRAELNWKDNSTVIVNA